MASTNPLQRTDSARAVDADSPKGPDGRRLRTHGRRASRRGKQRDQAETKRGETDYLGLPDWEGIRPIVMFLIFPGLFAAAMVLTGGGWDPLIMYGIAGLIGLYVAFSALKGVELVFACILFYIPFSKTYAIPIAPMVNGTNLLILLGLGAALLHASDRRQFVLAWPPGTTLVTVFALFTMLSGITVLQLPGGFSYLRYTELLNYKSWIDQFILFFVAVSCIRDVQAAKRAWVYMMVGSALVVIYSVPEMLDKMGRSTIEKSRIEGPHRQSNNFGGFVAYTTLPLVAFFVVFMKDLRAWLITPYFLVCAKILITTFSRGAYLAFAAGCLFSGYLKSGRFLAFWVLFAISVVAIFPQVLPEAILARMGSVTETQTSSAAPEQLDRSSEVRLIMWRAASRMILEDPIFGKGFKAFPKLKEDYTEQFVEESDPHSMYLYLGSQMGLPSIVLFVYIMGFMVYMGYRLARSRIDRFARAIGVGGASASVCYAIVCIFGSRAVNPDFTLYFWTYFVVMAVLYRDLILKNASETELSGAPKRLNAFLAQSQKKREQAAQNAEVAPLQRIGRRGKHRKSARVERAEAEKAQQMHEDSEPQALSARQRHKLNRATKRDNRKVVKDRLGAKRRG